MVTGDPRRLKHGAYGGLNAIGDLWAGRPGLVEGEHTASWSPGRAWIEYNRIGVGPAHVDSNSDEKCHARDPFRTVADARQKIATSERRKE